MKDIQQLIKKENNQEYKDIYPKTYTDAVLDKHTGTNLADILNSFNMYFIAYAGSKEVTRVQVPTNLRRKGLWITYIMLDDTIVTEYYNGSLLTDDAWQDSANWVNSMQPFDKFSKKNMTCRFDNFTDKSTSSKLMTVKQGGEIVFSTTDNRFYYLHRDVLYAYWEVKDKPSNVEFQYKDSVYTDKLFLCKDRAYVMYNGTLVDIARFIIDKELSLTSNNPIANSTVTKRINEVNADATTALTLARELKEEGRFQINGNVTNNPDEEDITVEENKLKFKDKVYNAGEFSGLGRVYLRKNIVNGKNVLTQEMINKTNTIYIIQYDYDLDNKEINVPENCTLQFEGGGLKNGVLNGNNTFINNAYQSLDVILHGIFTNNIIYTSYTKKKHDDSKRLNNLISLFNTNNNLKIIFDENYNISKKLILINNTNIEGYNIKGENNHKSQIIINPDFVDNEAINVNGIISSISISGLRIIGNNKIKYGLSTLNTYILGKISNIYIEKFIIAGIAIRGAEQLIISDCRIYNCGCGIFLTNYNFNENDIYEYSNLIGVGNNNATTLDNNYIINCDSGIYIKGAYDVKMINNVTGGCKIFGVGALLAQGLTIITHYTERDGAWSRGASIDDLIDDNKYNGLDGLSYTDNLIRANMVFDKCTNLLIQQVSAAYYKYKDKDHIGVNTLIIMCASKYKIDTIHTFDVGHFIHDAHNIPIITLCHKYIYINNYYGINNSNINNNNFSILGICGSPNLILDNYNNLKIDTEKNNIYLNKDTIISTNIKFNSFFKGIVMYNDITDNPTANHAIVGIKHLNLEKDVTYVAYCFYKPLETIHNALIQLVLSNSKNNYLANNQSLLNLEIEQIYLTTLAFTYRGEQNVSIKMFNNGFDSSKCIYSQILISKIGEPICDYKNINMTLPISNYMYFDSTLNKYIAWNGKKWTNLDGISLSNKTNGLFSEKPLEEDGVPIGFTYFSTDKKSSESNKDGLTIYYKGNNIWVDSLGRIVDDNYPKLKKGTTAQRPTGVQIGFTYKDTDLNKWIIWNGEAWENIDGTALG